jgi:hypothetical protein
LVLNFFLSAIAKDGIMSANDVLCPICRQPVDLTNFTTDEHGLAVHAVCYSLKKQGMSTEPLPPTKPPAKPPK